MKPTHRIAPWIYTAALTGSAVISAGLSAHAQPPAAPATAEVAQAAPPADATPTPTEVSPPAATPMQPTPEPIPVSEAAAPAPTETTLNAEGVAALDLPKVAAQAAAATPPSTGEQATAETGNGVTPLAVSGSFFTRYELRSGYAAQGLLHPRLHREGDNFVYRARLGVMTHPVDLGDGQTISATFIPQAHGVHAAQGQPPTTNDSYDLRVHEAFIRWQGQRITLDTGRFEMNYGDGLVIGNSDWNEAGRAFQGARVHYVSPKKYWVDLFATLIREGGPATAAIFDGDVLFYGAYAGLGGLFSEKLDWDFYALAQSANQQQVDTAGPTDPDPSFETLEGATELTLGTRVKHTVGRFDYRIEGGVQLGDAQTVVGEPTVARFAYQADAEFGLVPAKGLRLALGGLVASGDGDPSDDVGNAWNELYPTGHRFLGLSDVVVGRSNALSGNASASYEASESLIFKLDAHLLSQMEENAVGESFAGTEIDAQIISPLGRGAVLRGLYGAFLPNVDYWPTEDNMHYVELQFGYDFK